MTDPSGAPDAGMIPAVVPPTIPLVAMDDAPVLPHQRPAAPRQARPSAAPVPVARPAEPVLSSGPAEAPMGRAARRKAAAKQRPAVPAMPDLSGLSFPEPRTLLVVAAFLVLLGVIVFDRVSSPSPAAPAAVPSAGPSTSAPVPTGNVPVDELRLQIASLTEQLTLLSGERDTSRDQAVTNGKAAGAAADCADKLRVLVNRALDGAAIKDLVEIRTQMDALDGECQLAINDARTAQRTAG